MNIFSGLKGQAMREANKPRMHKLFDRTFRVVGSFPNTVDGARQANEFMEATPGAAVLEVTSTEIILADRRDEGIPA